MDIQHDVIIVLRMKLRWLQRLKHETSSLLDCLLTYRAPHETMVALEAEAWNVIVIGLPTDVICDVS